MDVYVLCFSGWQIEEAIVLMFIMMMMICISSGFKPSLVEVHLGVYNISKKEPHSVVKKVQRIVSHDFTWVPKNDIALLQMETPIQFTDYIQPICLIDKDDIFTFASSCHASGFGHTSSNNPGKLAMLSIPILQSYVVTISWNQSPCWSLSLLTKPHTDLCLLKSFNATLPYNPLVYPFTVFTALIKLCLFALLCYTVSLLLLPYTKSLIQVAKTYKFDLLKGILQPFLLNSNQSAWVLLDKESSCIIQFPCHFSHKLSQW